MFSTLQTKLEQAFKKLRGKTTVTEKDLEETMKEVRLALLEADVNFKVVKDFCARVSEKALGSDVLKSLSPGQQIIKLVYDELVETMGGGASPLNTRVSPPFVILLVGLQGAGKTTAAAKLARYLKEEEKKKVLLVPADVYRPAAIEQLKTLAKQIQVEVLDSNASENPVDIARRGVEAAKAKLLDGVIIDTAGRLQINEELMDEVKAIKEAVSPHDILLVADAMTGQEAVNVAKGFNEALQVTGLVLTKLDGDARGGAALSMRAVTGQPIKFVGLGEKPDALQVFHPDRLAQRILGMGDVLSLIEKASKEVTLEDTLDLQKKFKKNEFSLDDFLNQLRMVKRMGSISSLMGMMPGMGKLMEKVNPEDAEREMKHIEAIILSMTPDERRNHAIIDGSRRKRIAKGAGRKVEEVNKLLKQFTEMKKVMGALSKGGLGNLMNMFGGKLPGGLGNLLRR